MINILNEYSELTKQTNHEFDKVCKKLEAGEEFDSAVKSIHNNASTKTKQMIETLIQLTAHVSEYVQELITDLKELKEGEQEFIFEDSEWTFSELSKTVK